jgi:hypothetical protein
MFTRSHLSQGGPVDITLQELQSRDISQLEATSMTACTTAHLRTVQSFAMIFFGTKHKHSEITQKGYLSHGATLQQLNRALSEPHCYRYDEIIQSVMTLAIQETLVPSGQGFFMKHMQGLEKLLALRDPSLYCPPTTISLYKCLRHMLLFASLIAGMPSILAKPHWKDLFHRHSGSVVEEQEQQLYDFLADCSVLAFERDELQKKQQGGDAGVDKLESIRHKAQDLGEELRAWRTNWGADVENAFTETIADTTSAQSSAYSSRFNNFKDIAAPVLPTDLVFSSIKSSLMLMLYNIALMNLLKILLSLPAETQQAGLQRSFIAMAHSAVLDVCRIMPGPFDTESQQELHASPVLYWAVRSARMVLRGDESTEGKWLTDMLNYKSGKTLAEAVETI